MANNLSSNVSTKVAKVFVEAFEATRVLSKSVDTTIVDGMIQPDTGSTVYVKRPTQYKPIQTTDGDISASTKNSMGVGRAAATVQNFITVPLDYTALEEVTLLDQFREIVAPAATAVATDLELMLGAFMIKNSNLSIGTPGTPVDAWSDVASANALLGAIGAPADGQRFYVMNDFTQVNLAVAQGGLRQEQLVKTAWEQSRIALPFAGMSAISSNALNTYASGVASDRAGALAATPNATWATHKDTMIQTLSLTGLSINTVGAVKPGDILEFTGTGANARSRINMLTRQPVMGADGTPVKWRATVLTGCDTDGAGAGTVTVAGPAIYGTTGLDAQYQTISAPLTSGDVFNVLGSASTTYQPNMFFHKSAFGLATVPLRKLHATDTIAMTKDGLSMRVTQYSDGDKNLQRWRIDLLPVLAVLNPFLAGQAYGL